LINDQFQQRLRGLPMEARKLLSVIVRQAYRGSLRSKEPGIATLPEVHEACGLDVDGMYAVLRVLLDRGVIQMSGQYPFEEIHLTGPDEEAVFEHCEAHHIPLDRVLVDLEFEPWEA
jgi:hypothetical protein